MPKKLTRKDRRRAGARQIQQLRSALTPKERKELRKARRRAKDGKARIGIKQWAMRNDLQNKAALIEQGVLPPVPVKAEA